MRRPIEEAPFVKRRREQLNSSKAQEAVKKSRLHKFVDWLNNWHVTRLFQAAGSFLLILTLVGFYFDYQDRQQSRIINAWQLITTKASGNSGKKEALEYLNSIGVSLNGIDLSVENNRNVGVYLANANLPINNFNEANLSYAYLAEANLKGSFFNEAYLRNTLFMGADLTHSLLRGADLTSADFFYANLTDARFILANLTNATLIGANLSHTMLSGANLTNANLRKTNLTDANLIYANLKNAKGLTCKQLTKAKNWQKSYRNKELACGADIPIKPLK